MMGKSKGKGKSGQKVQPTSRWSKFLIPGVVGVVILAGVATWFFIQKSSAPVVAVQYTGGPRLWVDSDFIDFGTVRFEKFVTARFRLRNVGDQPLRLAPNPPVEVVEGC
jgi:hypothetical protein